MPTLKQLTCHVEWSSSNVPLQEFQTLYADGFVETYIAVPAISIPFSIHLHSDGYIAPGLAMFVYMDGEYQCNRNRTNLKIPDGISRKKKTEVDFIVRQKEEIMANGSFRGKQWRFGQLNIVSNSDDHAQRPVPHNTEYLGTIEVVVLRCYAKQAHVPAVSKNLYSRQPPSAQASKPARPKASNPEILPSSDDESSSSSSSESVIGGLFDGGSDSHRITSTSLAYGGDGNWDESAPKQGPSYQQGTPKNETGSSSARIDSQQRGYNASKQPISSQDWDTPEIDRPRKSQWTQIQSGRNSNDGKDRDRAFGNSKQSPAISSGHQSNKSVSRSMAQGHLSTASPAIVINVSHTPQLPINWVPSGASAPTGTSQINQASVNEGTKIYSNNEEENWEVLQPMPGAWDDTSNESAGNARSWEKDENYDGSYWDENINQSRHDNLDNTGNNNATNWDNSNVGTGYNDQNLNAKQDTNTQEWNGFGKDPGNDGTWGNNDKFAAPAWNSYPNNDNNQQGSATGQVGGFQPSNYVQPPVSSHPGHTQSAQQAAWGAASQPFIPPAPWQQPVEAPDSQNFGEPQPQMQPYQAVSSNLSIPIDSRPKPHWSSWKKSNGAISKPNPITSLAEPVEPLYSVSLDIAQQKNMSHQVHVGQPAAYIHKRSSPKYMDSFESPYAVFVFKYRSKAILEQILNIPLHVPEAEEKQRLLGLSKEELVEHVLKGETKTISQNPSRSEGTSATNQSRSSSGNTIKPDGDGHGNPAIPQFDISTAQDNPVQPNVGDYNTNDNVSTNPSYNWGRGTPNPALNKQSYTPEVKVNSWLGAGDPRGGNGNPAATQDYGNENPGANQNYGHVNDSTNWKGTPKVGNSQPSSCNKKSPSPSNINNQSAGSDWNKFGTAGAWTSNNVQNNKSGQNIPNTPQTSGSWNKTTNAANAKNATNATNVEVDKNQW